MATRWDSAPLVTPKETFPSSPALPCCTFPAPPPNPQGTPAGMCGAAAVPLAAAAADNLSAVKGTGSTRGEWRYGEHHNHHLQPGSLLVQRSALLCHNCKAEKMGVSLAASCPCPVACQQVNACLQQHFADTLMPPTCSYSLA